MPNYWAVSTLNCRKYGPIWQRKKCSSTMTMHQLTPLPLPWPNCSPIYHILQIWHRATLFVSKPEKVTRRAKIWWCHHWHGGLLCRPRENIYLRWVKEVGASLDQVHRAKRRLCWEINHHFSKIFVFFFCRLSTYRTTLVLCWWEPTDGNTLTLKRNISYLLRGFEPGFLFLCMTV